MSYITEAEMMLVMMLPSKTPWLYQHVSNTQLSIARHYGATTINNSRYIYIPTTDELIREDVMKMLHLHRKSEAKRIADERNAAAKQTQAVLI